MRFVTFVSCFLLWRLFRQCLERRRTIHPDLFELLGQRHLIPEIERRRRVRHARAAAGPDRRSRSSVPPKSRASSRSQRRILAADDAIRERRVGDDLVDEPGDGRSGSLSVTRTPRAVHRRRHGRRGVGDDRHAHVKRFHQRHAEALVLAGAEEDVGHLVVGDELFVRYVTEEVHVGRADASR